MKELLQQALDALTRLSFLGNGDFPGNSEGNRIAQKAVADIKQALAQQEQCGCREGECETKKDKTCRMTIEIAERDGIPEWTPAIGIECAISNLRDDAARLRDGSYTPLQIADDLDVIANDLAKCKPDAQQEQPTQEASATWTEMVVANLVREGVNKHRARELAAHFLTLPTQPALSDDEVLEIARQWSNRRFVESSERFLLDFARELIEAHCRGGNHG